MSYFIRNNGCNTLISDFNSRIGGKLELMKGDSLIVELEQEQDSNFLNTALLIIRTLVVKSKVYDNLD